MSSGNSAIAQNLTPVPPLVWLDGRLDAIVPGALAIELTVGAPPYPVPGSMMKRPEEAHVEKNRALCREKFEAAVKTLWKGCGVKLFPGRYLTRDEADGTNPGADYVRAAMDEELATPEEALERIVATLR